MWDSVYKPVKTNGRKKSSKTKRPSTTCPAPKADHQHPDNDQHGPQPLYYRQPFTQYKVSQPNGGNRSQCSNQRSIGSPQVTDGVVDQVGGNKSTDYAHPNSIEQNRPFYSRPPIPVKYHSMQYYRQRGYQQSSGRKGTEPSLGMSLPPYRRYTA